MDGGNVLGKALSERRRGKGKVRGQVRSVAIIPNGRNTLSRVFPTGSCVSTLDPQLVALLWNF